MFTYQFISTIDDLLEAEETERSSRTMRAPFRWIAVAMGTTWLTAGIALLAFDTPGSRPFLWILLGAITLYVFLAKPYCIRSRIRENNAPSQEVRLEFHPEWIQIEIFGVGECKRNWDELVKITPTSKGIMLLFSDGITNWLPNRIFSGRGERDDLIKFIERHVHQEELLLG